MGPKVFFIKTAFRKKIHHKTAQKTIIQNFAGYPSCTPAFHSYQHQCQDRKQTKYGLQWYRYNIATHLQVLSLIQLFRQFLYLFLGSDEDSYL